MRLRSLRLTRYGNFADATVMFDTRPGCLNLLAAPNGAGKSVLRTAFGDLLFTIPGQTPMGFRFGYAGMRIAAEAVAADGQRITLRRRKGQGNTLLDAADVPHDPALLAGLIGRADRPLLERLFALDTERLRRGGAELLESGGALADALLAAGGLRGARQICRSLEAAADALAPSRRSAQKRFYVALDGVTEARRRAAAALLRPDAWERLRQALADAEAAQVAHNQTSAEASRRIAQLQRIRRVRAPLAELDAATEWLAAHADAPDLPASLQAALTEAVHRRTIVAQQLEDEAARRSLLAAEDAAITVDAALLAAAADIERLGEQSGAVAKALADIPQRAAEHGVVVARIIETLHRLGSDLPPDRAAELIAPRAAESRARALITRHGAVAAPVEQGPDAIAVLQREIAAREADLAQLVPSDGMAALAPLVAEIRAEGDPATRAQESTAALGREQAALTAALAKTPRWQGGAPDLLALAPLPVAAYERLEAARRRAGEALARQSERVRLAEDQRTAAAAALTSVTGGEAVPDAVAVAAARRLREQGWHLVYRLAFTPDPPTPDEQRDFSGGQPLPLAYERAVQHADAVADRRVAEADLIARATAAQAALQAAADAVDAQAAVLPVAQRAVDAAEAEWTAACAPLGLGTAPGIEDVRAFLTARERVVERAEALQRAQSAEARLSARHAEWASRLAAAMAASPNSALPALLAQVEARLAEAGRREKQRIALDAGLRELRLKREQAEANLTKAHEKLAAWQAEWTASLAQLGRPAGEPPAVTADILQLLTDLDADRKQAARLAERVQDMRADNTAFTAAVAALLGRDARDLASPQGDTGAMLTAIRTLRERLQAERARATKRTQLREQIAQADRQITQLRQRLAQRQAEEQQVLRAIGADTLEAAEQRLAASRERAGHAEALARATAKLREDGDALPIETLRAELAAIAADDAPAALAAAETAMAAANTAAQQQAADAARQHRDLDQRTADAGYESAISDQQAGMATLARVLDEAMQYRLAALLLGRALAAVEGQDTPAMLTRIGGYFRTLTDGAYERVVVAEDDTGGLALTMIPRDLPDEHKRVGDLSEGTRDQLFLALRLAAIEDHVAAGPALPFVGDDILQTSDDARATAALHALCDLSRHVQVILLTHHAHIQQLAAALPTDAVHVCALAEGAMVAA